MTSKEEHDTDPATGSAIGALAPTDPSPGPGRVSTRISTDPGVGPPSEPGIAQARRLLRTPPMGIVVPSSSPVKPRKDSVELLLDGMQGPQPEHPKTTPQTDGEASAAYHAEHSVRPARTSPDEQPKVMVERPPQAPTTKIERRVVQAVLEEAVARPRAVAPTVILPQQIAPRVIVAAVAGVVVVLCLFVVLRFTASQSDAGSSAAMGVAPALPPAVPPLPPTAPLPTGVAADDPRTLPTPVGAASTTTLPAATTSASKGPRGRAPRVVPGATGPGGDLGEFKPTLR